ncbi:DUF7668 domain-containing protein [Shewanella fidelis]|uniref:DUF7668 domain-containing protein n=1 Tax=Shewanella fidelis TaxID=173509 RepID=A0AAW8NL41_9GAMM|nr:hypothetical protein [Shewanella fidelis]MDR8523396.1 hypothetical protein [Shewanella fidelis]MDW4813370.1 hypothetical protein [Shewanella fidelis]MDW4817258.1 hypothetical protein [Shewanella fidelis]MDW4821385.1 hypothetical protein [Shewanella fidelis]MDW4824537.1 hypothetical protein [Shewanella fidelis]
MIEVKSNDKESELKDYCQQWLGFLASGDFEAANRLVDSKNCYGLSWGEKEIAEVILDYYGEPTEIEIHNYDITECEPNYLVRNDRGLLYDFNLPINGELTDLTVQFEFNPKSKDLFEVVIHDIHVL